ncbi:unnamed protein product [Caenorhabditis brenneri]
MKTNQNNAPLLPTPERPTTSVNSNRAVDPECCKATTLILVVLFVCGVLAFALSIVVWHFYDGNDVSIQGTSSISTLWIVVILFFCAVLSLGLPAAVWKYYDRLDNEPRSSTESQSVPIVSQELTNIINSAPPVYETRIIGYYGEFESRDIKRSQLEKLTHAIVACVRMDKSGRLKFKDEEMRQKFLSLKTKASNMESGAKVMVSVGGNDNSEHFTTIMASARRRKKLINQIILFITEHQIEGVNLFWEQPPESHKFKYSKFLKNLRLKLSEQEKKDDKKYILSLVVPRAGIGNWESGFDLDVIIENVDFINVLTMDYYAPWPSHSGTPVGPSAPLYSGVGLKSHYNVNHTMQYYICETRRPDKFNIIIPFYIRLWRNVNERLKPESEVFRNVELIDGKVEGTPYMSKWTVDHEGWKLVPASWDQETRTSFIFDHAARTFLTFENDRSLAAKMDYVNEMNLGGVWIWSIHTDDDTLLNSIVSRSLRHEAYGNDSTIPPV